MQTKIEKLWQAFTLRYAQYWFEWQQKKLENVDFVLVLFADGAGAFMLFIDGEVQGRSDFNNLDEAVEQLQNELFTFE